MAAFLALQCHKCCMFQVKQEKKSSNKWVCAICNEKQSVRQVVARSFSAKDVRKVVQDLNLSHGAAEREALINVFDEVENHYPVTDEDKASPCVYPRTLNSKWAEYCEDQDHANSSFSMLEVCDDDVKYVTSIPEVQRRKRKIEEANSVADAGLRKDNQSSSKTFHSRNVKQTEHVRKGTVVSNLQSGHKLHQNSIDRYFLKDSKETVPNSYKSNLAAKVGHTRVLQQSSKWADYTESEGLDHLQNIDNRWRSNKLGHNEKWVISHETHETEYSDKPFFTNLDECFT